MLFGVVAGLVGCYRGLTVQGGPKGVGTAVERDRGLRVHLPVRDQRDHDGRRRPGLLGAMSGPTRRAEGSDELRRNTSHPPGLPRRAQGPSDTIGEAGACSMARPSATSPNALTRYRKETIRNIAEMTMGTGRFGDDRWHGRLSPRSLPWRPVASSPCRATRRWATSAIEALTGFLSAFSQRAHRRAR